MSTRTVVLIAAFTLAVAPLAGCAAAGTESSAPADAVVSGSPVAVADEMTALCKQMITEALPVEAAIALADAGGYATQVSVIDGEPQATTKDYREDRFTLETTDGAVTACTIG